MACLSKHDPIALSVGFMATCMSWDLREAPGDAYEFTNLLWLVLLLGLIFNLVD